MTMYNLMPDNFYHQERFCPTVMLKLSQYQVKCRTLNSMLPGFPLPSSIQLSLQGRSNLHLFYLIRFICRKNLILHYITLFRPAMACTSYDILNCYSIDKKKNSRSKQFNGLQFIVLCSFCVISKLTEIRCSDFALNVSKIYGICNIGLPYIV